MLDLIVGKKDRDIRSYGTLFALTFYINFCISKPFEPNDIGSEFTESERKSSFNLKQSSSPLLMKSKLFKGPAKVHFLATGIRF